MDKIETIQHKQLHDGRWAEMSFAQQMANVGSEVYRLIKSRRKGNEDRAEKAFFRALELIDLTIASSSSHSGQLKELCRAREELCGLFVETDEMRIDPNRMIRYYDQFASIN